MSGGVDIRSLAIERREWPLGRGATGRRFLSRFALPAALLGGFALLLMWAGRDWLWPPREVEVILVRTVEGFASQAGEPSFNAAGWIEPRPTPIRVPALAAGAVEQMLVVEDQAVAAGEPVAELVKADAELACRKAESDLRLRQAELAESQAALVAAEVRLRQPVHLQAPLAEAEALLARVETERNNLPFQQARADAECSSAEQDYRGKQAAEGVVAAIEIERARAKWASAQAAVEELSRREESLRVEHAALAQRRDALQVHLQLLTDETQAVQEARARVDASTARVAQSQIAVTESQLQLERMTVRAPQAGRVYQVLAQPGSRVGDRDSAAEGRDGSTVVTLYRPDQLQVRVDVRFENIPIVTVNQRIEVTNPALDHPVPGRVLYVGSQADVQKNTLVVKVALDDPPPVLRPEMLVDVAFIASDTVESLAADSPRRLFVPRRLVIAGSDGDSIWVADQNRGVARRAAIEVGRGGDESWAEVKRGLQPTSRLIASPGDWRDGQRIRVIGERPAGLQVPGAADTRAAEASPAARSPTGEN